MCLALTCEVIAVTEKELIVDFSGIKKKALNLTDAKPGDFVIVQQGIAIEKVNKKEAKERIKILAKVKKRT